MANAKPAKTANRKPASQSARPVAIGAQTIFIPCNHGANAYVFSLATGQNPNLVVGSAAFDAAVGEYVAAGHSAKVVEELTALAARFPNDGWGQTLAGLKARGVLAA